MMGKVEKEKKPLSFPNLFDVLRGVTDKLHSTARRLPVKASDDERRRAWDLLMHAISVLREVERIGYVGWRRHEGIPITEEDSVEPTLFAPVCIHVIRSRKGNRSLTAEERLIQLESVLDFILQHEMKDGCGCKPGLKCIGHIQLEISRNGREKIRDDAKAD